MERPIPAPHPDDDEDVSWALSTASALWSRGEGAEALKWLRRAAETASDANRDLRAVELFKIAADVASSESYASQKPPPIQTAPSQSAPSPMAPPAPAPETSPNDGSSARRPPPPPPRRSAAPSGAPPSLAASASAVLPAAQTRMSLPTPSGHAGSSGVPSLPAGERATLPATPSGVPTARRSVAVSSAAPTPAIVAGGRAAVRRGSSPSLRNGPASRGKRRDVTLQEGSAPPSGFDPRSVASDSTAPTRPAPRGTVQAVEEAAQVLDRSASAPPPPKASEPGASAAARAAARLGVSVMEMTSEHTTFAGIGAPPAPGSPSRPRVVDEITVERTFFETPESIAARVREGLDDLDEQTNELAGDEPGLEIGTTQIGARSATASRIIAPTLRAEDVRHASTPPAPQSSPGLRRDERRSEGPKSPPLPAAPPVDATPTPAPVAAKASVAPLANPRVAFEEREAPAKDSTTATMLAPTIEGITSYRVAIVADRSSVQLVLLKPGEAAAEGLATAFIVPLDAASSEAIATLLTREKKP